METDIFFKTDLEKFLKIAEWNYKNNNFPEMLSAITDCISTDGNLKEKTEKGYIIAFGSAKIEIQYQREKDILAIESHILNITGVKEKEKLFHKLLCLNYNETELSRFSSDGDKIYITYVDSVKFSNPLKILNAIKEVFVLADRFDNILAEEFGAAFPYPELAEKQNQKNRARQEQNVDTAKKIARDFTSTINLNNIINPFVKTNLLSGVIFKILFSYPGTTGLIETLNLSLEKAETLEDTFQKIEFLSVCVHEIYNKSWVTAEDFPGEPVEVFRNRFGGDLSLACDLLKEALQDANKIINQGNNLVTCYFAEGILYKLLYTSNLPKGIRQSIENSLQTAERCQDIPTRARMLLRDMTVISRMLQEQ